MNEKSKLRLPLSLTLQHYIRNNLFNVCFTAHKRINRTRFKYSLNPIKNLFTFVLLLIAIFAENNEAVFRVDWPPIIENERLRQHDQLHCN
jgi:hypothetical protein